jgi:hypothetical protein
MSLLDSCGRGTDKIYMDKIKKCIIVEKKEEEKKIDELEKMTLNFQ